MILIFSCNYNEKPQTTNKEPQTTNPVFGSWRTTKDTSHVIKLTEKEWIDMYNGEVVSTNTITFLSEGRTRPGIPNRIKLEESKNNFYYFEIHECDSTRLVLFHVKSGQKMEMVRE